MDDGWPLLIIIALAAASLFFSVNSVALRVFSRLKIQEAFKELGKENQVELFVLNSERLLLSCRFFQLLSNVLLMLCLFWFFEQRRGDAANKADYIWTFISSIILFSLCSVAIPNAWAKYGGEKLLSRTYGLLKLFYIGAIPVVALFNFYDKVIMRLAGVSEQSEAESHEEKHDELMNAVEQSKIEGVVDAEQLEMIENVLDLSESTAGEIITPRTELIAIAADSDLETVKKTVLAAGHSRIPVYERNIDNIVGLVYAKDLLNEIGRSPDEFKLKDRLREAYFVPETKSLRDLLHEFQDKKQHMAIVLDEYGGTAGIVTIEDILEELVGEIVDEYEKNPPATIKQVGDNTVEVSAKIYVDDLNSELDLDLPEEEDYDTVGGFVFSHLGYIPKTGESFTYENVKITVSSAEARKIKRLRITKLTDDSRD